MRQSAANAPGESLGRGAGAHREWLAMRLLPEGKWRNEGGMDEALKSIGEKAVAALPGAVLGVNAAFGELTLIAEPRASSKC